MKIVITGALGHIGSRVIRELPAAFPGAEIVMVDNLSTLRYCSLFNLHSEGRYRFFEADVVTADLKSMVTGANAVLHLAAITDATSSFKNKELVEHNNFYGTVKIAEACVEAGCPMIHISSTSVYGTQQEVVDEEHNAEELKPQSPYAVTKLKEERFLRELGEARDFRFVVCRFGTVYGVSPGMRFHTAVNKFCWQAATHQPVTVWRTALHQKRPYLALEDAVNACIFIIRHELFDHRVYNVLTDNLTVNEVIQLIRKHLPQVEIEYVDREIMNQLSYEVSCERFRCQGFHFTGSIEKSIDETINLLKQCHWDGRG